MPLTVQSCSVAAETIGQITSKAVQRVRAERVGIIDMKVSDVKIVGPIPVYSGRWSTYLSEGLGSLEKVGWRYALLSDAEDPIATVYIRDGGEVIHGDLLPGYSIRGRESATAFVSALSVAGSFIGMGDDRFECRFLSFASLYLTGVWMHGAEDLFVLTRDGGLQRPIPTILTAAQVSDLVRVQLGNRRKAGGPDRPGPSTNGRRAL